MKKKAQSADCSRLLAFAKRNVTEMIRDPLIYIFCLGFPVLMIVLFQVINRFTDGGTPVFEAPSLVPGIMMFSFTFAMLMMSLLVSKDRSSAFLVRLYTSPMKTSDFVLGYALPCVAIGVGQEIVCLAAGGIASAVSGTAYFSFADSILLALEMLPMLFICIFLGVFFGSVLNDKAAPGITSVFITAAGLLGGAWMPLDVMGGFETFCRCLPFYPSVYIGRIITGALHTAVTPSASGEAYTFDTAAAFGLIPIVLFLAIGFLLAIFSFRRNMTGDRR